MLKYLIILLFIFGSQSSMGDTETWDCSKITLKKFKFAKDCATSGMVSAKDKRDTQIKQNKNCSIVVDIAGKEKTLNFLVPSPHWRDDIGLSWQCEGTKGTSFTELAENCNISLNQGTDEGNRVRCNCSKFGCGQSLVGIMEVDKSKIQDGLQKSFNSLDKNCDDLAVGGSVLKDGKTSVYLSSLKCPIAERGPHLNCSKKNNARNLSYNNQNVAVVCIPESHLIKIQKSDNTKAYP